jgi:hypothetical protein
VIVGLKSRRRVTMNPLICGSMFAPYVARGQTAAGRRQ